MAVERPVQGMVARIYTDVPNVLHGLAGESVWSHLVKLEGANRVHRIEVDGKESYELLA